jgi:hypothetical protein
MAFDYDRGAHAIIAPMTEWTGTFRLFLLVAAAQIACCATVAVMGMMGGVQYKPGANDVTNIGSALIFSAILFGGLGIGLMYTVISVYRGSGMGRVGVFLAELLFALFAVLFFAPIAVLFAAVAAAACVLLVFSRQRRLY